MAEKIRKLVNRADIIKDIDRVITPVYFPDAILDKNRTSVYAWLTESEAKSIEDTITLEQRRANDYCPELSDSEIYVNQVAKLRDLGVQRAVPGRCYALLCVLKSDILEKGIPTRGGNEIQFIIDRRSTILYSGINFSLEDDIIIRAVRRGTQYLYAANYTGEHSSYESYIQVYEHVTEQGEELLAMICQIYQAKFNITDQHINDLVEFTYDGLIYDYDDRLASFEVFYKPSNGSNFKKIPVNHYLSMTASEGLLYNDDESNVLRILNNPLLDVGVNSIVRVEIRETLGTEGNITINRNDTVSFSMYHDAAYNYSGVHVFITMLSDCRGALDGDSLADLKKRMIDAKVRRDNITTEHDIMSYVNDIDANLQIVKKRNDTKEHHYYLYTLMRYEDDTGDRKLAPATTKRFEFDGVRSPEDLGDFDRYDHTVDRKLIRAYNKFKLHVNQNDGTDFDYVTKCDINENDPNAYYLTCPFMMMVNDLNIISFYYTSMDEEINLSMKIANNLYPFQMISRYMHIYRDSHSPTDNDIYTFTVKGMLNTENDTILVDEDGNLLDHTGVRCYIFFTLDSSPTAYMVMDIDSYNKETREFIFKGTLRTTDYITEKDKLEVTEGLYEVGTGKPYNSVIDFKDATVQVSFMYKDADPEGLYPKDDSVYTMVDPYLTDGYILMNSYYNNPNNLFNLILEFSKFSRSPTKVTEGIERYHYSTGSVPFFEFNFGIEYTSKLFPTFKNMTIVYGTLLKLTTGFDLSLKFIATYGASKYIYVMGGRTLEGEETYHPLNDLNPRIYFKVYGFGAPVDDIYQFIYEYLRDTYITGGRVFMSNICTAVEETFDEVYSIKYMGINEFDASFQQFIYRMPNFVNEDIVTRYVPEQLNVTDIHIDLDET